MKKFLATLMLLMCVSMALAGTVGGSDGVIDNPNSPVCHDKNGRWSPQSKDCDPASCGCLFHEIEEFIKGLFE
jgi:hypothetical protein